MKIAINDKYRLKSDVNQWMIQVFSPTVKKPDNWKSIKYFHDPTSAVTELAQMMIRSSDAETVVDALEDAKNAVTLILDALKPEFDVRIK